MKKIAILLAVCLTLCPLSALAANDVAVQINGTPLEFDVPAQIINDRTMVPMRKIFETFGFVVQWIESSRTIISINNNIIIAMGIDSTVMNVTNLAEAPEKQNVTYTLDSPPVIVGDRTLVPVRAIAESLGKDVNWDDLTRTVLITDKAN